MNDEDYGVEPGITITPMPVLTRLDTDDLDTRLLTATLMFTITGNHNFIEDTIEVMIPPDTDIDTANKIEDMQYSIAMNTMYPECLRLISEGYVTKEHSYITVKRMGIDLLLMCESDVP